MTTIYVEKKDCYFYAKRGSDGELFLSHINYGENKFYETSFDDLQKLAKAHGWQIKIKGYER